MANRPQENTRLWLLAAALAVASAALALWLILGPESLVAALRVTMAAVLSRDGAEASAGLVAVVAASAGLAPRRTPDVSSAVARPIAPANAGHSGEPLDDAGDVAPPGLGAAGDAAQITATPVASERLFASTDDPLVPRPRSSAPARGPPVGC